MLPKTARLSRQEFSTVFARPERRTHLPEYSLYFSPSSTFKVAVVAGKKVAKQAVDRNRLRREVYGSIQTAIVGGLNPTGQYIIILKPPYAKLTKANRQAVITTLLAQNLKSR